MDINYKKYKKSGVICEKPCKSVLHPLLRVSVILSTTCARESQDLEEEGGTGRRRDGRRNPTTTAMPTPVKVATFATTTDETRTSGEMGLLTRHCSQFFSAISWTIFCGTL